MTTTMRRPPVSVPDTPRPSGRGTGIGPAEERIVRTFARFIGAATLLFGVLLAPGAASLAPIVTPWWTPMAAALVLVPMLALWPASHAADPRWIRRCGTVAAVGYLVTLVTWLLVVHGSIPPNRDIWLATFPGLITMAAALGWRPAASLGYLAVAAGTAEVVRYVTRTGRQDVVLPVEILAVVVFCGLFVIATIAGVQTARALDRTIAVVVRQSAVGAATAARTVEHTRLQALIRDRVMCTLLGLARRGNTPELSEQAAIALTELDGLQSRSVADEALDRDTAIGLIRAALGDVDGHTPVQVTIRTDTLPVPRRAARAIASAAAEALRNSLRHADTAAAPADRLVAIDAEPGELRVVVADNGRGFDPDRVPGFQLGITTNIRDRMATADGCTAVIRSAAGLGTQVTLLWADAA
ncbi:ATP-binding protein [Rhodococcus sp. NPDC003318]|uniref:ATP-binding protein n=1 Tax=Rhodococcus sp. NPDC003318 TaxID=3364503 RepID=UPI00367D5DCE